MRYVLLGILCMLTTITTMAQTPIAPPVSIVPTTRLDSLTSARHVSKSISGLDTLVKIGKADSLIGRLDSLKQSAGSYQTKADSMRIWLNASIEKLANLPNVPAEKLQEKISSLNERLNQQNQTITERANKLSDEVANTGEKLQEKASSLGDRVGQKSQTIEGGINKISEQASKVSGEVPNINVPGVGANLDPGKLTEKIDIDVPGTAIDIPDLKVPELDLQQYSKNLDLDKIVPTAALDVPAINTNLEALNKVPELTEQINKISSLDMSADDAAKLIEDKVTTLEPVQDLVESTKAITAQQAEYEALIQKYKDSKAFEKEVTDKAKNVANDILNQYSPAFLEAQTKISKARRLFPIAQSFKEGKFLRINELKEMPRYERFVPGITMSTVNAERFHLTLGIQTRYLLTTKFSIGVGGFSSISFGQNPEWVQNDKVYGYRIFGTIENLKTMFAQLEFSQSFGKIAINNKVFSADGNSLGIIGLGRRFNISRKIGAAFLILYPVLKSNDIPGQNKISTRIEINYKTKKRTKLLPPPANQ